MTHYLQLGVSENASAGDIRKAYLQKAAQCPPDRNLDDPGATQRFQSLVDPSLVPVWGNGLLGLEAYTCLKDHGAKAAYDRSLREIRAAELATATERAKAAELAKAARIAKAAQSAKDLSRQASMKEHRRWFDDSRPEDHAPKPDRGGLDRHRPDFSAHAMPRPMTSWLSGGGYHSARGQTTPSGTRRWSDPDLSSVIADVNGPSAFTFKPDVTTLPRYRHTDADPSGRPERTRAVPSAGYTGPEILRPNYTPAQAATILNWRSAVRTPLPMYAACEDLRAPGYRFASSRGISTQAAEKSSTAFEPVSPADKHTQAARTSGQGMPRRM